MGDYLQNVKLSLIMNALIVADDELIERENNRIEAKTLSSDDKIRVINFSNACQMSKYSKEVKINRKLCT